MSKLKNNNTSVIKIMISYRRNDSAGWAGWLNDHLTSHFGNDQVFFDIDNIPVGENFLHTITDIVFDSSIILVLIGQRWLEAIDANGINRLHNFDDTLRVEIRTGLQFGIPMIPVLVDNALMPSISELPIDIQALSLINAHDIDNKHFKRDADALIVHIKTAVRLAAEKMNSGSLEEKVEELRDKLAVAESALIEKNRNKLAIAQIAYEKEVEEFSEIQKNRKDTGKTVEYKPSSKPFNAFISYSHTSDREIAKAIQAGLANFARPWFKTSALRVFLTETNIESTPDILLSINKVIDNSEYFILIASPQSAKSRWVEVELNHWLKSRGPSSILIVLVDGIIAWNPLEGDFDWELSSAVPLTLKNHFKGEPLYLDLRGVTSKNSMTLYNTQFKRVITNLAAVMLNRSRSDLVNEEIKISHVTNRIRNMAIITLLILLLFSIFLIIKL